MADSEHTTPASEPEVAETEAVVQVLGMDPWMRFDLWAARAWDSTEGAIGLALGNGDGFGDSLDGRVMALFHSAQIAKEFAEMVNPLCAVVNAGGGRRMPVPSDRRAQEIMAMLLEDDESESEG